MHTVDTIMSEMMKLRVHIAPVGFEIDRVVIPAIKMKADKVYLLRHNDYSEDKSGPYLDKIVKKLEKVNIKTKTIGVNRYRLFGIIKVVKEIIQNECDNDVYLKSQRGNMYAQFYHYRHNSIYSMHTMLMIFNYFGPLGIL